MKGKLRIGLRYAGYGFLTLLLTLYFMFLSFPFSEVQDRILPRLEAQLPFRVAVEDIRPTPFLSLDLVNVEVFPKAAGPAPLLELQELRVRPSLLDLLIGRQTVRIRARLLDGSLGGKVSRRKGNWELAVSWDGIHPGKHPLLKQENAQLDAAVSGDLDLKTEGTQWIGSTGTLSLNLADGSIQGFQVSGFTLPQVKGVRGSGSLTLEKRKAVLDTLTLTSDELSVSLNGNIDLAPRLNGSRLNLTGKLKLSGQLATQYEPMLSGFLRKRDAEGFFNFSLRGTLGAPRFSG